MNKRRIVLSLLLGAALAVALPAASFAKTRMAFGGGPTGGTFNYFSNAIAIQLSKAVPDLEVSSEGTGGSAENLKRLNSGDVDYGIVYSGDLWLGSKGELPKDDKKYDKVRPVAYLYGAPAQLVVLAKSGITSPKGLAGKKVAVGNAGSGAALSAERYFRTIGLWDNMEPQFLGYSAAASALGDGKIDAFWVLVGYPNASIIEAATTNDIMLLDLVAAADEAKFFEKYPFYAKTKIPANTYKGQDKEVSSFKDSALWCSNKGVDAAMVTKALEVIFSPEGLDDMVKAHKAAKEMSIETGIDGFPLSMHKGAQGFWSAKRVATPDAVKAAD